MTADAYRKRQARKNLKAFNLCCQPVIHTQTGTNLKAAMWINDGDTITLTETDTERLGVKVGDVFQLAIGKNHVMIVDQVGKKPALCTFAVQENIHFARHLRPVTTDTDIFGRGATLELVSDSLPYYGCPTQIYVPTTADVRQGDTLEMMRGTRRAVLAARSFDGLSQVRLLESPGL